MAQLHRNINSTKFRAQNSKKNNFNQKKIERHIAYIDNKLDEYTKAISQTDGDSAILIQQEIEKQQTTQGTISKPTATTPGNR